MSVGISVGLSKNPLESYGDRLTGSIDFDVEPPETTLPAQVVFAIDKSGSMGGSDIQTAREGLVAATRELRGEDSFGVVAFDSDAEVIVPPTRGSQATQYHSQIDSLSAGGGTSIMSGLQTAHDLLADMPTETAITWIVLITDGGDSVSDPGLQRIDDDGVTVHTAGIGSYNQNVIKTVAEQTQGEWENVGQPQNLQNFFAKKLEEARNVAGLNPVLEIEPTEITDIKETYHTYGHQQSTIDPEWDGLTCKLQLSDLIAGKEPTVQLDLFVDGEPDIEEQKLADVTLRTEQDAIHERVMAEIADPVIVAEENEGDSGALDGVAISDIMEAAVSTGTGEAQKKIDKWEQEEEVSEDVIKKSESVISNMAASDEKEAKDEASRVLSDWSDDDS